MAAPAAEHGSLQRHRYARGEIDREESRRKMRGPKAAERESQHGTIET
ncbi:MAG TPA: hypothetical protein VMV75_06300 [Sulfuricella sp.]|nr:hypothetical protein [Sulfuricella sp.]